MKTTGGIPGTDINMRIVASLPAYNEERYIGSVILKTAKYTGEIYVIDDGSNDATAELSALAGAKVLRHETNRGKGAALATVLQALRSQPPDALVFLDADGQHDSDEIPRFIAAIRQGYDLVIGARQEKKHRAPLYRRLGQRILSAGTVVASRTSVISDSECGFRAVSPRFIREIDLTEKGFAVETEMIVKAAEKGLKITDVPISTIYVKDGSTQHPLRHGLGVLGSIINMISERRPLLFFGVSGAVLFILGLIAGIRVLLAFSHTNQFAIGTALLCAVFLIVGVFSIFTGIVLNILSRNQHRNN